MFMRTVPFPRRQSVTAAFLAIVTLVTISASTLVRGNLPQSAPSFDLGKLPLNFEPNAGQAQASTQFVVHSPLGTLNFAPAEVILNLPAAKGARPATLQLSYQGANADAAITGGESLPGKVNYLFGNDPSTWRTQIPTYSGIQYTGLYDGINLAYEGTNGALKGTYTVEPHANPSLISWRYNGASGIQVQRDGSLLIAVPNGVITEGTPLAWQNIDGVRIPVASSYVLGANNTVGFTLGTYDANYPLTIDPTLSYSTYFGGNHLDTIVGVRVDAQGNIYIAGETASTDLPLLNPIQPANRGSSDVFVTKLNAAGNALIYSTYLGGTDTDEPHGLAIDASGNVYVTGETQSTDYPTFQAYQPSKHAYFDAFVSKLAPSGSSFVYSTYLGGSTGINGSDAGLSIAADAAGNAYVSGETASADFPLANAFQPTIGGSYDAFLTKFNPGGSALVYSTFLGGSSFEQGMAVAVDSTGSAYVTGRTDSDNFPTEVPIQPQRGSQDLKSDGFVTKFNASGSTLAYSTYLGGSGNEPGYDAGIAVDASGNAYVTGVTESTDFPTFLPYQGDLLGSSDVYLSKLNPAGSAFTYSTYLGGSSSDGGTSVAADNSGNAYVTGYTYSSNFPVVDASQPTYAGGLGDAFVAAFPPSGTSPFYSTYLGGQSSDEGYAITVDSAGDVWVGGSTSSIDFSTTTGSFQPGYNGFGDGFVSRFTYTAPPTPTGTPPTSTPRPPTITNTPTVTNTPNPCGINWNYVSGPSTTRFTDVDAVSADDIWAVGSLDVGQQSAIAHWNGTAWSLVSHPNPGTNTNYLYSVHALAPDDVWAVGAQNSQGSYFDFVTLHWDGSTWSTVTTPSIPPGPGRNYLYGVSATAPDDVWAVGSIQSNTGEHAITLHWDGSAWSISTIVNLNNNGSVLRGVVAIASDDVWAVGRTGTGGAENGYSTFTMHWDGTSWEIVASPNPGGAGVIDALYDVDAVSSDDVYAVGTYGNYSLTLVLHWNGTAWTQVATPNAGTGDNYLNGIDVISANDIWAVGSGFADPFSGLGETIMLHWNGSAWSRVPSPNHGTTFDEVRAVAAVSPSNIWAVGYTFGSPINSLILQYSDACSTPQPTATGTIPTSTPTVTRTPTSTRTSTPTATPTLCSLLIPLSEGFEGNDLGSFVADAPICPAFCGWAQSINRLHTGLKSAHGADVGDVSDQRLTTISPINISSTVLTATLTFWHNYSFDMHYDGGVLEGSTDGGNTWFDLEQQITSGGYTGTLVQFGENPLAGRTAWTGANGPDFTQVSVDLTSFRGETLLFRFRIGTDVSIGSLGWWVDDIQVEIMTLCGGSTATPAATSTVTFTGTPGTPPTREPTSTGVPPSPTAEPTTGPATCNIAFTDVFPGSTFYNQIMCMACMGYVGGYPDGTFRPYENVTRGQIAKIVANFAQLPSDLSGQTFEDVPPNSTFYNYIESMAQAGYVGGYPCGGIGEPCGPGSRPYYRPGGIATRGQITKIVASAAQMMNGAQPETTPMFADVPSGSTFFVYAQTMGIRSFMQGYECGGIGEPCGAGNLPYFRPSSNATRGQTAKIANNAFYGCSN